MRLRVKFNDGRKRILEVKEWSKIHDIKNIIMGFSDIPPQRQRLFFRGKEVGNSWCVASAEDGCTLSCVITNGPSHIYGKPALSLCQSSSRVAKRLRDLLEACKSGLALNLKPLLALDGLGGTYFLRDSNKQCVACFKPMDEEPGGANNPRGLVGTDGQIAHERGILAGDACGREMAAYLLDHNRFAGVPATAMAEASHPSFSHLNPASDKNRPKLGMLQEYVVHDDVAGDVSSDLFPTREVHKIALLDIRCINTDRNEGNILVRYSDSTKSANGEHTLPKWRRGAAGRSSPFRKGSNTEITLIPIDHGYCFPASLNVGWCDWCWLQWKQTSKPFDKATMDYIRNLNPDQDIERIRKETSISKECLRNFKIATLLLKQCAAGGLLLSEIADIMTRRNLDEISDLEEATERSHLMANAFLKSPRARAILSTDCTQPPFSKGLGIDAGLSPPKKRQVVNGFGVGRSQYESPAASPKSPNRNLMSAFDTSPIQEARACEKKVPGILSPVVEILSRKHSSECDAVPVPGGFSPPRVLDVKKQTSISSLMPFLSPAENEVAVTPLRRPEASPQDAVKEMKVQDFQLQQPAAVAPFGVETTPLLGPARSALLNTNTLQAKSSSPFTTKEGNDEEGHGNPLEMSPMKPLPDSHALETSPIEGIQSSMDTMQMTTNTNKVGNDEEKFSSVRRRPRQDSLCTSDDETFHRSPQRSMRKKSFASSEGSSASPQSPPRSPSSPGGASALTRTFSYSEAMFALPSRAGEGRPYFSGPRALRHRSSGHDLDQLIGGDQIAYDRCFYGYLEKLFGDLIDLRIRARREKRKASGGGGTARKERNSAASGHEGSLFDGSTSNGKMHKMAW